MIQHVGPIFEYCKDIPHILWSFPSDPKAPGRMKCRNCHAEQETGAAWDAFIWQHARCPEKPPIAMMGFVEMSPMAPHRITLSEARESALAVQAESDRAREIERNRDR